MTLDQVKNFAKVIVSGTYDANAYEITVDDASRLPDPNNGEYNVVWYNDTDYPDPADDPNVQIVRVVGVTGNVLTLENVAGVRTPQEGTTSNAMNLSGKTYKIINALTKKMIDDIRSISLQDLDDVNGTDLTTDGQIPTWHDTEGYFDFDKNINDYALQSYVTLEHAIQNDYIALTEPMFRGGIGTCFINDCSDTIAFDVDNRLIYDASDAVSIRTDSRILSGIDGITEMLNWNSNSKVSIAVDLAVDTNVLYASSVNNKVGINRTPTATDPVFTVNGSISVLGTSYLSFNDSYRFGIGGEYINSPTAGNLDFGARGKYRFYADTNVNESDTATMYEWHTKDSPDAGTAKMVLLNNGNVGIGTTNPAAKLHISGLGNEANGLLSLQSVSSGADGALAKLGYYSYLNGDHAGGALLNWGARFDGETNTWIRTYTTVDNYLPFMKLGSDSKIHFGGAVSNLTTDTNPTWSSKMVVDMSTGDVGIGTTIPGYRLSVYKGLTVDGTNVFTDINPGSEGFGIKMGAIRVGGVNYPGIWLGQTTPSVNNYAFLRDGDYDTLFNTPVGRSMEFRVDNATQMMIASTGNILMGTTTDFTSFGGAKLQVRGTGSSASAWKGRIVAGGDNATFLMGEYNSKAWLGAHNGALSAWEDLYIQPEGSKDVFVGYNGTTLNTLTDLIVGGKAGFGTTTPAGQFHIHGGNSNQLFLTPGNAAWSTRISMGTIGSQAQWYINSTPGTNSFGIMNAYVGGVAPFNITYAGNVGIGTTTPSTNLHLSKSGTGIQEIFRLTNSQSATVYTGVSMMFNANRTTGGLTNIAGISAKITDINNSTYAGELIFSQAYQGAMVDVAKIRYGNELAVGSTTHNNSKVSVESENSNGTYVLEAESFNPYEGGLLWAGGDVRIAGYNWDSGEFSYFNGMLYGTGTEIRHSGIAIFEDTVHLTQPVTTEVVVADSTVEISINGNDYKLLAKAI